MTKLASRGGATANKHNEPGQPKLASGGEEGVGGRLAEIKRENCKRGRAVLIKSE